MTSKGIRTSKRNTKKEKRQTVSNVSENDNININDDDDDDDVTAGEHGVEMVESFHQSKYQQWTKQQVLTWLKENLVNNGLTQEEAKEFLKEFVTMTVTGGTLHSLKNDSNFDKKFEALRREFSNKNQGFGIWTVVQTCIENLGQNIHVD